MDGTTSALEHSAATATHATAHSSTHATAHTTTHSSTHSSTHTTAHAAAIHAPGTTQSEHSGIVLDRHDQVADAIDLGNHLSAGVFRRGDLHDLILDEVGQAKVAEHVPEARPQADLLEVRRDRSFQVDGRFFQ